MHQGKTVAPCTLAPVYMGKCHVYHPMPWVVPVHHVAHACICRDAFYPGYSLAGSDSDQVDSIVLPSSK
jgi:hypothetical protein